MSTKSTILLTKDNEHWYEDCNSSYYLETESESAIVLEIDGKHKVTTNDDGSREVVIEQGTPLYDAIMNGLRRF